MTLIQTILQNGSLASCVTAADGPVCAVNIIVLIVSERYNKGTMERLKDILSNLGPGGDRVEVLEGIKPALSALSRKDMEVLIVSLNIFQS